MKGQRIQRLPPVITFSLNRYDLNYETCQRIKVNDRFEYPLELNMAEYLDSEAQEDLESSTYELKSIVIHRGGAYGGHYHAYIQDELKEGEWYLEMPEQFKKEPVPVLKK